MAVKEPMNIVILWKRGQKKIDTQVKPITPETQTSVFNEKFQMKTQLEWDSLRNQFRQKKSVLSVHLVRPGEVPLESANAGTAQVIGDADFDLAYYANHPNVLQDKLPLKNCTIDKNGYIEIYIKTNASEVQPVINPTDNEDGSRR